MAEVALRWILMFPAVTQFGRKAAGTSGRERPRRGLAAAQARNYVGNRRHLQSADALRGVHHYW